MADDGGWMEDHGQRLEQERQETLARLERLTENFTDNVDASRDSNAPTTSTIPKAPRSPSNGRNS